QGVVCQTCVPAGGRLVHGNELLAQLVPGYPKQQFFRVSQHTFENVVAILQSAEVNIPIGYDPFADVDEAIDVFVGYLMLDAWIANTDRHHENWALVMSPKATVHLAPSY